MNSLLYIVFMIPLCMTLEGNSLNELNINNNWYFREYSKENDNSQYLKAEVPGTVHLDLLRNNLIPDPYYRDNEQLVQWIEKKDWEYKVSFEINSEILTKDKIYLIFEGIDTHSDIFLNGELILKTNNYFITWIYSAKDKLLKNNTIVIIFKSTIEYDKIQKERFMPNIIPVDNPNRTPFSRKPRYHYGWDWGPRLMTSGVFKPFKILSYNHLKINEFNLETLEIYNQNTKNISALIKCEFSFDLINQKDLKNLKFNLYFNSQKKIIINGGSLFDSIKNSHQIEFIVENIDLWWSRGLGSQTLYEFKLEIYTSKYSDSISKLFGIRKVKLLQTPDKNLNGTSFKINLNSLDVFLKGANYIPPDMFYPRVSKTRYDQIFEDIIFANYNAIRIWGGGYFESIEFYSRLDELGIMVVHDLMFACEMYPGTPDYLKNYEKEIEENIKRIKTHVSIVLWIGNNEVNEAWNNWGFQANLTENNKKLVWGWYDEIFNNLIPSIINKIDSTRPYWPSSPLFGYGHSESLMFGDSHFWSVWAGGKSISYYNDYVGRFMTEYGMQGILDLNSISHFTKKEDRNLNSSTIKNHEKHLKGFQNLDYYINEIYGFLPKIFDEYVYISQIMQAFSIKLAVNNHRYNKPYCMGTLYWQMNDVWPSLSWSSVDYYEHWKALHYTAREIYQDLIIIGKEINNNSVSFNILNEFKDDIIVKAEIYLFESDGNFIENKEFKNIFVDGLSNNKLIDWKVTNRKNLFFNMKIYYIEKIYESNFYFDYPKNISLVENVNIKLNYDKINNIIKIKTNFLVKNLYIFCENKYLKLSNNYFDVIPNRNYEIEILNIKEIGNLEENEIKLMHLNMIKNK